MVNQATLFVMQDPRPAKLHYHSPVRMDSRMAVRLGSRKAALMAKVLGYVMKGFKRTMFPVDTK